MGFIEILLVAIGLSMDAFAVSVCKGLTMRQVNYVHALVIALFFGVFQAGMPLVGWALGSSFASYVEPVDHWVTFGLLTVVGAKMIWDACHEDDAPESGSAKAKLDLKELVMLAITTSIDALAVGVSFAFMKVNIVVTVFVIGITTFALSFVGVIVGNHFGARFRKPATIFGGVVLIALGVKTLLEHLGIIAF